MFLQQNNSLWMNIWLRGGPTVVPFERRIRSLLVTASGSDYGGSRFTCLKRRGPNHRNVPTPQTILALPGLVDFSL